MNKTKPRSPLNDLVPRLPGQSGRKLLWQVLYNQLGFSVILWISFLSLTIADWAEYWTDKQPSPWVSSILFIATTLYLLAIFPKSLAETKRRQLGFEGEIVVGRILEGLRYYGYTPIHDVPGRVKNGAVFNIDHVLIGPTGIFALETKTFSKHPGDQIQYKQKNLYAGSHCQESAVRQAQTNAKWLSTLLTDRLGEEQKVIPILTFPGWWVDKEATEQIKNDTGVYVFSAKAIGSCLDHFFPANRLTSEQIQQVVKSLSNYVYKEANKTYDK